VVNREQDKDWLFPSSGTMQGRKPATLKSVEQARQPAKYFRNPQPWN
jgi:hypothetical protein